MSPSAAEQLKVQKGIFDLDTFEEVTVQVSGSFHPVSSTQEALQRVGNDSAKFLELVNEGLRAEAQRELRQSITGWKLLDEDGQPSGEFTGTIADVKAVNALVLTLAKTVFGYSKDLSADAKAQAKANAMGMIKNTAAIRDGLKKSAALSE